MMDLTWSLIAKDILEFIIVAAVSLAIPLVLITYVKIRDKISDMKHTKRKSKGEEE